MKEIIRKETSDEYGYYIIWKYGEFCYSGKRPIYRDVKKAVKNFIQDIYEAIEECKRHYNYVYVDIIPELQMVKITEKISPDDDGMVSCCMLAKTVIEPGMWMAIEDDEEEDDEDD